ncbi:helix-turn-helix domain-containing protein [Anaerotruncus massiliensis (ex Liu et al. 2021)]|uniref:helix-turn-helix domain-containing protein n=1 Tax=Anaerotruncus massiliensis (ex Liu et al. 2021) TaxID=2321404 RepID=UPI003AB7ED01
MVGDVANGKYQEWLTPEGLLRLEGWARDGLTDEQIASNAGITAKTLYEWKNRFSEICEALKRGKDVVDRQVENALLKRALGYRYTEVRIEESEKDGQKITRTEKVIPPDTTAQIFWLKNRKPAQWRDKPPDPPDPNAKNDNGLLAALEESAKEAFLDGVFDVQPEAAEGNDVVETPGSGETV